jgi:hypothetical protein
MHGCLEFRARLERCLAAGAVSPEPPELGQLSWHEHLLGCADCRELLESERALEILLATLPAPELPRELSRRILERLRRAREGAGAASEDRLDALLALDQGSGPPPDLAQRVLASLRERRAGADFAVDVDERLDALLERARAVDEMPEGLDRRVLAYVMPERRALQGASAPRALAPSRPARLALAAALVLGVGFALWRMVPGGERRAPRQEEGVPFARAEASSADVPDALLASLDVLETWEDLEGLGVLDDPQIAMLEGDDAILLELLIEALPEEFAGHEFDAWIEEEGR